MSVVLPEAEWRLLQEVLRGRIVWRRLFAILHLIAVVAVWLQLQLIASHATTLSLTGIGLGFYMVVFGISLNVKRSRAAALLHSPA